MNYQERYLIKEAIKKIITEGSKQVGEVAKKAVKPWNLKGLKQQKPKSWTAESAFSEGQIASKSPTRWSDYDYS